MLGTLRIMSSVNANASSSVAPSGRPLKFEELVDEFKRYMSFLPILPEPYKSHIKVTIMPFFVYIYLSALKGKRIDIALKFFSRFYEQLLLIDGFTPHLHDLVQFKTINEARNHHYFQGFCYGRYRVMIPEGSLEYFRRCLKRKQCGTLLILLERLGSDEDQNNQNCSQSAAIPPIMIRNEGKPETTTAASSFKIKESTSQRIEQPGTSSSLRNTDITNNCEDQNISNCSQSTAASSIVIENSTTKMIEKPETATAGLSFKIKESTTPWIEQPGTSSSLRNTDVTNNCEDQNISNCSQSTAASSIVIEITTKPVEKLEMTTLKRKRSTTPWIEQPGTSSSLRNTDVKTNSYKVEMLHCIMNYGGLDVVCADVNPEKTLFACGFENSTICIATFDLESLIRPLLGLKNEALRRSYPNASGTPEHIFINDLESHHCLTGHSDVITGLAFAPSGLLMSCSDDTTARLWRMCEFRNTCVYRDHGDQIKDIAVSDNEIYFATASIDCTARLWNFERKTALINFRHSYEVERLRFDPNCRYLATLSAHRTIQLWTVEDGRSVWTIPELDSSYLNCITISPDGKRIAYADEAGFIKVWDLSSRKLYSKGKAHNGPIYHLAYNADNSVIASCAADRFIKLWNTKKLAPEEPVPKKRDIWMHEKLAKYYAASFNPCHLHFRKRDFLITINSRLGSESS